MTERRYLAFRVVAIRANGYTRGVIFERSMATANIGNIRRGDRR
jgi:hypothetical protein